MDMMELGEAVKKRRKTLSLTQEATASPVGMSRATLSNLENGKLPELGMRKFIALCSTLGLEVVVKEAAPRPTLRDLIVEQER